MCNLEAGTAQNPILLAPCFQNPSLHNDEKSAIRKPSCLWYFWPSPVN